MEEQKLTNKHQSGLFKYKFNKPRTKNLEIHAPIVRLYAPNFLDGALQTFWTVRSKLFGRYAPNFLEDTVSTFWKRHSPILG